MITISKVKRKSFFLLILFTKKLAINTAIIELKNMIPYMFLLYMFIHDVPIQIKLLVIQFSFMPNS